ncbi:MAG: S1/P1 nuclease [Thermoanaerobaculia bacterium]|nr:S1/P1 nuclease [Thermoanaerobaculia bacterium]
MRHGFSLPFLAAVLLCCFAASSRPLPAWTPAGHEVICTITESLLEQPTRAEVHRLLAILDSVEPETRDFPGACSWLDHIREQGFRHLDRWHYVNLPINPQKLPLPPPSKDDVIFAIRQSVETLRDPAASEFGRAFALRVLIHVVGDIHQPLHTVSRFSTERPKGDRGGNDYSLAGEGSHQNLHLLWDRGVGLLPDRRAPNRQAMIRVLARELVREIRPENLPLAERNPRAWAEEGRELAKSYVYAGIEEDTAPSPAYLRRAEPVVRRQLILAAYRLADLLHTLPHPPQP